MQLNAKWTDDCQGKKDYDGVVVSVSTRYWPQGGGWTVFRPGIGIEENEDRPWIKPSANVELVLHRKGEDEEGDYTVLASVEIERDTPEEVFRAVERHAQDFYQAAANALLKAFHKEAP